MHNDQSSINLYRFTVGVIVNDAIFVWTNGSQWEAQKNFNQLFLQNEVVESIGNPAGIGQGTGLGLRERDRDGIGLGHYRLRTNIKVS